MAKKKKETAPVEMPLEEKVKIAAEIAEPAAEAPQKEKEADTSLQKSNKEKDEKTSDTPPEDKKDSKASDTSLPEKPARQKKEPKQEPKPEPKPPAVPEKDKNYVSAVVYLGDEKGCAQSFLQMLTDALAARFAHYELVLVEDASRDGTEAEVRRFLDEMEAAPPITMIHLSLKQGLELAMNAGLDMAVGDFVYEFDTMKTPYPAGLVLQAYDKCLEGNDIVSVAPEKSRSVGSRLFYRLFNSASSSKYPLRTDVFRLISRRGINRVHGITQSMPYRKAAYAASGLKMATLTYAGDAGGQTEHLRFSRAVDSLALYTDIASRFSIAIAVVMLVLMIVALVYTLLVNFTGLVPEVAPGWTTTMLMLTGGFFAVFLLLAFVLKYLGLLVELVFRKQTYLVESVEKIK